MLQNLGCSYHWPFCFGYICLLICGLSSHSRIFQSYGDVIIACEGQQILTYALHSWSLSSEGSLTCHTHCATGLLFITLISEDPWHSHLLPSVWQWSCHYLFSWLRSVATRDRTPISGMKGECSSSTPRGIICTSYIDSMYKMSVQGENS